MLSLITECLTHLARRPRKVMARRAARKASLMAADDYNDIFGTKSHPGRRKSTLRGFGRPGCHRGKATAFASALSASHAEKVAAV